MILDLAFYASFKQLQSLIVSDLEVAFNKLNSLKVLGHLDNNNVVKQISPVALYAGHNNIK